MDQENASLRLKAVWLPKIMHQYPIIPNIVKNRIITSALSTNQNFLSKREQVRQTIMLGPTMFALSKMKEPYHFDIPVILIEQEEESLEVHINSRKNNVFCFPLDVQDWVNLFRSKGVIHMFCANADSEDAYKFCKWLPVLMNDVMEEIFRLIHLPDVDIHVLGTLTHDLISSINYIHEQQEQHTTAKLWGRSITNIIIHSIRYPSSDEVLSLNALTDEESIPGFEKYVSVNVPIPPFHQKWVGNIKIAFPLIDENYKSDDDNDSQEENDFD